MSQPVEVPRTLDAPARFLFWDVDYVLIGCFGLCAGLIVSGFLLGTITSAILIWCWSRIRAGAGLQRAMAATYWYLPVDLFTRVPASARRHFFG